jgi:DHA1 family tetracycline resistance protein-like MFS transporter
LAQLNPLKAINDAFARPNLRSLLVGLVLISLPFMFYASNISVLAFDAIGWGPGEVGLLLSIVGVLDIAVQGGLLALLVPRIGERGVVIAGVVGQAVACAGLAMATAFTPAPWLIASAALAFAACQGGMTAALEGLMSNSVGPSEQGWLAGAVSAIGSATQMLGPLMVGWLYSSVGHAAPYWLGLAMIVLSGLVLARATRPQPAQTATAGVPDDAGDESGTAGTASGKVRIAVP